MDNGMSRVLRAQTEMEHGKDLGAGIDDQPEPEHLLGVAEPGAEFVQLQVRKLEIAEKMLMEGVRVLPSAREPGGDGSLTIPEDPFGSGRVQPFSERREHRGDVVRRGFQAIQGSVASGTEGGAASLTAKGLDPLV